MSLNDHHAEADQVLLPVPEGTESGDPVVVGDLPGVALIDRNSDGNATVKCNGAFEFEVVGRDRSGNAAVRAGQIVFLQNDGSISVNGDGKRYGYALLPVDSGGRTVIPVKIGL